MDIKNFESVEEAMRVIMSEDQDYILIRHTLVPGEKIKEHYHLKAKEAVILDSGSIVIGVGDERESIKLKKGGKVVVVRFPNKINHWLQAKTEVSYFVLRDRKDRNIYVKSNG